MLKQFRSKVFAFSLTERNDVLTAHAVDAQWHPVNKFLFRVFFIYFLLYCFPFPLDAFELTKPVAKPVYDLLDWLVPIIGARWFNLHAVTAFAFFDKMDDSNYGLVFMYSILIVSTVIALGWSVIDRKRNYETLYQWLKLYLRFYLIAYLFGYGFIKVFPSQFEPITASRLTQTVGDQSPMLLAWNFMGYSPVMQRLNGMAEVTAGLLLLFRRTTTIGAILSAGVFSFVVLMDFCFNVPVRLLASHLLVISIFLTLEDRQKLLNIFLLNRPTTATPYYPLILHPLWRKLFTGLQMVIAVGLLYSTITTSVGEAKKYGFHAPHVPLYGVYNTAYFIRNHDTIQPMDTDTLRWKQLVIDGGAWKQTGIIRVASGKRSLYDIQTDTTKKILSIRPEADTTKKYMLSYFETTDQILLKGLWMNDTIEVLMNKYDLNNYLLHKEKFTWINN